MTHSFILTKIALPLIDGETEIRKYPSGFIIVVMKSVFISGVTRMTVSM